MVRFNLKNSKGEYHDPIYLQNETPKHIISVLTKEFPTLLEKEKIPFHLTEVEFKSGGLFGSITPGVIINFPNPPSSFFCLGMIVTDCVISFHLFGESKQCYKKNMHEYYSKEGQILKAAFYKPDLIILQKEFNWSSAVVRVLESMLC